MNRDELRAIQAPLKQRYRDAPEAACNFVPATCCCRRLVIDSDASPDERKRLVELTERYCVVLQTLRTSRRAHVSLRGAGQPAAR